MRRLTRWLRPHNHEIRSVARTAFQHRSGHPPDAGRGDKRFSAGQIQAIFTSDARHLGECQFLYFLSVPQFKFAKARQCGYEANRIASAVSARVEGFGGDVNMLI